MKKMKNLKLSGLMAFAFGLAILVGNSAFTPVNYAANYYTPDGMGGYTDVTNIVLAEDYVCNESQSECLVQFSNDNPTTGSKSILERGTYQQNP